MEFKRFSAGNCAYGSNKDSPKEIKYAPGVTNVNFYDEDEDFDDHINSPADKNHAILKEFIEALGICHTVID